MRSSWKAYVKRTVAEYASRRSSIDIYDEDVLETIGDAQLDQGAPPPLRPPPPPHRPSPAPPAADTAVLHFLISALRRKLEKQPADNATLQRPASAAAALGTAGRLDAVPPAPPLRRAPNPPPPSAQAQDNAAALRQREDVLQAQVSLAEAAVRAATQRHAATHSMLQAAQEELRALTDALAEQSRECSARLHAIEQEERAAAQTRQYALAAIACTSFALKQLGSLSPRVLDTEQVSCNPPPPSPRDVTHVFRRSRPSRPSTRTCRPPCAAPCSSFCPLAPCSPPLSS
jgi:hypothetical protein